MHFSATMLTADINVGPAFIIFSGADISQDITFRQYYALAYHRYTVIRRGAEQLPSPAARQECIGLRAA